MHNPLTNIGCAHLQQAELTLGCCAYAPRNELLYVVAVVTHRQRRVASLGEQILDEVSEYSLVVVKLLLFAFCHLHTYKYIIVINKDTNIFDMAQYFYYL